jgi:hypothetical protein
VEDFMRSACFLVIVLFAASVEAANNLQLKRQWIEADHLPYITDKQFPAQVRDGSLVEIKDSAYHTIDQHIDRDGKYVRPYVLQALAPLEQAYFRRFRQRLPISAAFRTIEHHEELRTRNANAAQGRSPHSTGYTIDISYAWMSPAEQKFLDTWFRPRHRKSLIYTKEHFQKCYDVFFRPPKAPAQPHHRRPAKR